MTNDKAQMTNQCQKPKVKAREEDRRQHTEEESKNKAITKARRYENTKEEGVLSW
jgi:hypothetical protein